MTAVPPPATGIDPAEALIVVTGLEPFLRHTSRDLGSAIVRSEKLPETLEAKIYRFLGREEPEPPAELPAFDFEEVKALIDAPYGEASEGTDHDPIERTIRAFGGNHQLALTVGTQVTRMHAYVKQQIPRRVHVSMDGPEQLPPARSELFRFRRCWRIATDPLSLFDGLQEYAVSRDQADCFAALFPTTAAALAGPTGIVHQALLRKKAAVDKWKLPRRKEILLRVLTNEEAPSLELARALAPIFAAEQQAQAAREQSRQGKAGVNQADEGTPTQRLDAAS
jgi:hypothetical protein